MKLRVAPYLILASILFTQAAQAQYDVTEPVMPNKRQSFGVNLTPAAVILMNGSSLIARFGAQYKYQFKVNQRIRVGVNYEMIDRFQESVSQAEVIGFTEASITYRVRTRNHYTSDFRLGLEWFKPNRTFSMVYGVDAFAGVLVEQDSYDDLTWDYDGINYFPSSTVDPYRFKQEARFMTVGMDLTIGQQIKASDKVMFVVRWTPQFNLAFPIAETFSDPEQRQTPAVSRMEFRMRGIEVFAHVLF